MRQKKKQTNLRHKIEYFAFMIFITMVKISPLFLAGLNRKMIGFLFKKTNKKYLRLVTGNLKIAFPDASEAAAAELRDKVYRHFSTIFIEIINMFVKKKPEKILKKIEVNNIGNLEKALKKKEGVIIFTAHFGNWELVPYILNRELNRHIFGIARHMDNPLVEKLVKKFREFMGLKVIYKDNAVKSILSALKNNEIIYLLIDQNAIAREAVPIDFFGKQVSAVTSISRLHLKKGVPLVPLFLHYEKDRVVLDILEEIRFSKTGKDREDIKNLTIQCNELIEDQVKQYPEQWFWFHNRWKITY
ncbi:MAG: lysophospholipid acyltransferase family protein [Candidatus Aminicenantes bacterium]|nr:lysophospholipid acyltransferase family protein [Candidatus Aminicenantes bacterium]